MAIAESRKSKSWRNFKLEDLSFEVKHGDLNTFEMFNGNLEQFGDIAHVFSKPKNEKVARFQGYENIPECEAYGIDDVGGLKIEILKIAEGGIRIVIPPEGILISKEKAIDSKTVSRLQFRVYVGLKKSSIHVFE